jgi:hypothetical protein
VEGGAVVGGELTITIEHGMLISVTARTTEDTKRDETKNKARKVLFDDNSIITYLNTQN